MVGAVAGAVLWSLPIMAAAMITLLRYSFGSLFVVGESVAAALLSGTGADIAGTMERLQQHPWTGIATAGAGLLLAIAAAGLALQRPAAASVMAGLSAAWAWRCDQPITALVLAAGCAAAMAGVLATRP